MNKKSIYVMERSLFLSKISSLKNVDIRKKILLKAYLTIKSDKQVPVTNPSTA